MNNPAFRSTLEEVINALSQVTVSGYRNMDLVLHSAQKLSALTAILKDEEAKAATAEKEEEI